MYVKVTEAAEEFVALQKKAAVEVNWNNTAVLRAWVKLQQAVEEHQQENAAGVVERYTQGYNNE